MTILLILNVFCIALSSFWIGRLSCSEGTSGAIIINVIAAILNMLVVIYHLN